MKIITAAVLAQTVVVAVTVLAVQIPNKDLAPQKAAAGTLPATQTAKLSPDVEKLIVQLAEQEARLKNLMVVGETWEEISTEHGAEPWKRDVACTSVTAWYDGLPSQAARVDYHRKVSHWIQGAAPYYESSSTLAFNGKTGININHSEGAPGQVLQIRKATLLGPLTSRDFSGAGFATGTVFSIYRDPRMSQFLSTYLPDIVAKRPEMTPKVTEEDHEGVHSIRLSMGTEDKIQESWWFDPARGMAVLGYRQTYVTPSGRKLCNLETRVTKLAEVAPKLWYPMEAFRYQAWYPEKDDHFAGPSRILEEHRRRDHYLATKVVANDPNFDRGVFSPPIPEGYAVTDRSHAPGPTTLRGTR